MATTITADDYQTEDLVAAAALIGTDVYRLFAVNRCFNSDVVRRRNGDGYEAATYFGVGRRKDLVYEFSRRLTGEFEIVRRTRWLGSTGPMA